MRNSVYFGRRKEEMSSRKLLQTNFFEHTAISCGIVRNAVESLYDSGNGNGGIVIRVTFSLNRVKTHFLSLSLSLSLTLSLSLPLSHSFSLFVSVSLSHKPFLINDAFARQRAVHIHKHDEQPLHSSKKWAHGGISVRVFAFYFGPPAHLRIVRIFSSTPRRRRYYMYMRTRIIFT